MSLNGVNPRAMSHRVDEIDRQIDLIHNLIEGGARLDPELGAGLATSESLTSVQKKIDESAAEVECFIRSVKDFQNGE